MKTYFRRICDDVIKLELESAGAIIVEGPKWCGKTTTCEQAAKSAVYLNNPRKKSQYLLMVENDIDGILEGEKPRLIDEWQDAPQLFDAIRFDVDHADKLGRYILTGSAVPHDTSKISHSGTGRFAWVTMRPMSLFESLESDGLVSFGRLFSNKEMKATSCRGHSLQDMAFMICRGGWPLAVTVGGEKSLRQSLHYFDAVCQNDISRVDGIIRDPKRVRTLLRSLARLSGTQSSLKTIRLDIESRGSDAISENSISSYVSALNRIFVIEDMPAWCPSLRNKAVIRTSQTRYFSDPSIAALALGAGPDSLMDDLATMGLLFENLAVRDLRCYAQSLDGWVSHYHDGSGLECDAVMHLRNGAYGLVEIKLGGERLIAEGINTLTKLAAKIDTGKMNAPSFLMVVTATGDYAYKSREGVIVAPIGSLGP